MSYDPKSYDPKAHGAKCDECPLGGKAEWGPQVPVPASVARSPTPYAFLVGEGPGKVEVEQGAPFVGPTGKRLDILLRRHQIDRRSCHVTNATLCLPIEKSDGELRQAMECCRPRLAVELALSDAPILALGKYAMFALTEGKLVDDERGFIRELKL